MTKGALHDVAEMVGTFLLFETRKCP